MDSQSRLLKERSKIIAEMEANGGAEKHLEKERWAVEISDTNLLLWKGILLGPVGTPYESQRYELKIDMQKINYPADPPVVCFQGAFPYHANVYPNGAICIDILKTIGAGGTWSPVLKISSILASLVSMLNDPNTSSPANPPAGRAYDDDKTVGKVNFTKLATEHYIRQLK